MKITVLMHIYNVHILTNKIKKIKKMNESVNK